MGKRVTLSCKKCGYTMDANIGGGLGSVMPAIIEGSLFGEELVQWSSLYQSHELESFYGNSYIGYCPECRTLKNVYVLRGTKLDGDAVELGGICDTCGSKCRLYEDKNMDISCPECEAEKLDIQVNGLWD